jgi:hypothetical protein
MCLPLLRYCFSNLLFILFYVGREKKKFSAAGRRCIGILMVVSGKEEVPCGEVMTAAQHKNAVTSAGYQAANEGAHVRWYKALFYQEEEDKKDKKKVKKRRKSMESVMPMQQPMMPMMQQSMGGMMSMMRQPSMMPMMPPMGSMMPMMPPMGSMMSPMMMQQQQQMMMMQQQQQPMMKANDSESEEINSDSDR